MNGLAGGQKGHIKQKRGFTKQDVNLATGVSIAYLERTRSISATILGGGGEECFFRKRQREKEEGNGEQEGKSGWVFIGQGTQGPASGGGAAVASCLHLCLLRGRADPRPPQPLRVVSPSAESSAEGCGSVLFGPQTRMFTYKSQVVLSPYGMFRGSKTNMGSLLQVPGL